MSRPQFSLRATVRDALAAAGDAGLTLDELGAATGASRRELQRCLGALGEAGEKFAAPIQHQVWRHFATEAQRDAWLRQGKRAALSPDELRSIQIYAAKVAGSKKAPPPMGARTAPAAVRIDATRMRANGEAIITANTKTTRDATQYPTAKWQTQELAPDPRYPSFSSGLPGTNPLTGKAWEARA